MKFYKEMKGKSKNIKNLTFFIILYIDFLNYTQRKIKGFGRVVYSVYSMYLFLARLTFYFLISQKLF